jgi:glycosyltransferase involved in cell wall biosynthesis
MNPASERDGPLVSIVIPTWNSAAVLARALESLAQQTWRDFEVVLSDGASADATVEIARGHADRLPALQIDTRRDSGVYDAINRGVQLARGAWFIVLGSDDRLHAPDTLAQVAPHLQRDDAAPMVYGDVLVMDGPDAGQRYAGPAPLKRLFVLNICQQSIFYRRQLFDTLGGFDLRFRLYADWDFNLRAAFLAPTRWIDVVVTDYAATGMSSGAKDELFLGELPGRIRTELFARADDRRSWPLQDHLLRVANRYRRRGDWSRCFEYVGNWLALMRLRIPVLLRGLKASIPG